MDIEIRPQVLVVDNNEDVLAALGQELEDLGYNVVTTWSGIEALRLLKSKRFGSVLVDTYLPDIYIGDFLEIVFRLPTAPGIWIMQDRPVQEVCTYGARFFQVVDKKQAVRAFHTRYVN